MSFLEVSAAAGLDPEVTVLLDVDETVKHTGASEEWPPHQDLLDTSGAASVSDFDISSLLHQLTAGPERADVSSGQILPLEEAATGGTGAPDVSLSVLLGDAEADLHATLLAPSAGSHTAQQPQSLRIEKYASPLRHPSVPPPSPVTITSPVATPTKRKPSKRTKNTYIVVKKATAQQQVGRPSRAPPPYGDPPPAPLAAYSIFYKEQYQRLKASSRKRISTSRASKQISALWRTMQPGEKEPYMVSAEQQKERYKELLAEYRSKVRLWNAQNNPRRLRREPNGDVIATAPVSDSSDCEEMLDDNPADLYCALCGLYFSSSYNKQEHMEGKPHLLRMRQREELRALEQRLAVNRFFEKQCSEIAASEQSSKREGMLGDARHVENHQSMSGDGAERTHSVRDQQHNDEDVSGTDANGQTCIILAEQGNMTGQQIVTVDNQLAATFAIVMPANGAEMKMEIVENDVMDVVEDTIIPTMNDCLENGADLGGDAGSASTGNVGSVGEAHTYECTASTSDPPNVPAGDSAVNSTDVSAADVSSDDDADASETRTDVSDAMDTLMLAVLRRSQETRFLSTHRQRLSTEHAQLSERLQQLSARQLAASAALEAARQRGRALAAQLQRLLLLPAMFGVMQRYSGAEAAAENASAG